MDTKTLYKYIKGLVKEEQSPEGSGGKMLVTFADYDPFKDKDKGNKKKISVKKKSTEASSNTGLSGEVTKIDFDPEQKPTNGY